MTMQHASQCLHLLAERALWTWCLGGKVVYSQTCELAILKKGMVLLIVGLLQARYGSNACTLCFRKTLVTILSVR